MGWWNVGVLCGDPPLDILCDIEARCGVEDLYPLTAIGERADDVAAALSAVGLDELTDSVNHRGNDPALAAQVVGVVALAVGAPLGEFAQRLVDAARNDRWADDDHDRRAVMEQLIDAVEHYDGTPTVLASPGLFETMHS